MGLSFWHTFLAHLTSIAERLLYDLPCGLYFHCLSTSQLILNS